MEALKLDEDTTKADEIYLPVEKSEKNCLERLDVLKSFQVFIIQRKATVDYFTSNISYEIMDTQRNVIFKARKPKSIFFNKKSCKISVRNLRNVKLFGVIVERTMGLDSMGTEASVYVYPKKRIAYMEKYGGTVGPPCFEIFNVDRKTAFTIDHLTKSGSNSSMLEYDVSTKRGPVANIIVKTGLNSILSTDPRMPVIEKATLIGVILAMDLLKTGLRSTKNESASNQYMFN